MLHRILVAAIGLVCGLVGTGWADDRMITFLVESESVPADARVYVSGNVPALGGWKADGLALDRQVDGTWAKAVALPEGAQIDYKVTLGDWSREALDAGGQVPDDASFKVMEDQTVRIQVPQWKDPARPAPRQITGTVEVHAAMEYPGLAARDILVWLPPDYAAHASQRYPVLYLHDGQQVFDPTTSFHGQDWQVDETATQLIREGRMQPVIIVAMNNTANRSEEYSDTATGRLYADFIIHKLKPFIDETYRTLPGPESTAVMGSSMGGRISFLLVWEHPEVFSMAGCLSSAFHGNFVRRVVDYEGPRKAIKFYFDNGGVGLERILQPGSDWMLDALHAKGYTLGQDMLWYQEPGAEHNEAAWSRRAWMPLLFFFGKGPQAWAQDLPPPAEPVFAAWDRDPKRPFEMPALRAMGLEWQWSFNDSPGTAARLWNEVIRQLPAGTGSWISVNTVDHRTDTITSFAGSPLPEMEAWPSGLMEKTRAAASGWSWQAQIKPSDLREIFLYVGDWWLPRAGLEIAGPITIEYAQAPLQDIKGSVLICVPTKALEPAPHW